MGGGVVMRVALAMVVIAGMFYMFGRFGFKSFFEWKGWIGMKLVKIDDYTYVNPALIGAIEDESVGTNIYLTGSDKPIETLAKIEKVLDAISGSEEHSFGGYRKMKNKDLLQKVYVDVNKFNQP